MNFFKQRQDLIWSSFIFPSSLFGHIGAIGQDSLRGFECCIISINLELSHRACLLINPTQNWINYFHFSELVELNNLPEICNYWYLINQIILSQSITRYNVLVMIKYSVSAQSVLTPTLSDWDIPYVSVFPFRGRTSFFLLRTISFDLTS